MNDQSRIETLLAVARDKARLQAAQSIAGKRLLTYDGTVYPKDGCAITLSVLMQDAGIPIPDIFWALEITNELKARGWRERGIRPRLSKREAFSTILTNLR